MIYGSKILTLRLATWNINSVRLRMANVARFLSEYQIDILALQEIKTINETFPSLEFAALGYEHQLIHGMKSYNGVAILSRVKLGQALLAFPDFLPTPRLPPSSCDL